MANELSTNSNKPERMGADQHWAQGMASAL
jgi:hypothetical protein